MPPLFLISYANVDNHKLKISRTMDFETKQALRIDTNDITGDIKNLHVRRKQTVGVRGEALGNG